MTAFANRLAAMALGERPPGAAHVVLPPRFAPAPAVAPAAPEQWPAAEQPAEAADVTQPAARDFLPQPRDAPRHEAPPVTPSPTHITQPPVAGPVTPPLPAVRDITPLPRTAAMPESYEIGGVQPDEVGRPTPAVRIATLEEHHQAAARSTPLSRPLPPPPRGDPSPLSEAAVASRIGPSDQSAPVIHVTIDRIDVRAPQAERPAPQPKAARRQAAVSLGDYLRNGTGRGSRA